MIWKKYVYGLQTLTRSFPTDPNLRSLHSGMTSIQGQDNVNCDEAESIGVKMHQTQDNKNFYQITLKRSDCINTFIDLQKDVLIENHSIKIDPTILFSRLLALMLRCTTL